MLFQSTPAFTKIRTLWLGGKWLSSLMSHYYMSKAMDSGAPCGNAECGLAGWGACGPWLSNPLPTCLTPPTIALLIKGHFPLKIQSLSFKSPDLMSGIALHQSYAVLVLRLIHSVTHCTRLRYEGGRSSQLCPCGSWSTCVLQAGYFLQPLLFLSLSAQFYFFAPGWKPKWICVLWACCGVNECITIRCF